MSKLYLQNIMDDVSFYNLPAKWQGFDLMRFLKYAFEKKEMKYEIKAN